ncbi:MAG: hypothetical protein HY696_07355 [Deltaproteobacteria bacterium]|nr:hypothetical protein [Deltaproteobacteria bacterium]
MRPIHRIAPRAALLCVLTLLLGLWHPPAWAPNRVPFDHKNKIYGIAYQGPQGCLLDEWTILNDPDFPQKLQTLIDAVATDDQLCDAWGSDIKRIYTGEIFFLLKTPLRLFNASTTHPLHFESMSTNQLIIKPAVTEDGTQTFTGSCLLRLRGNVTLRNVEIIDATAARAVCIETSGPTVDQTRLSFNQIGLYVDPAVTAASVVNTKFYKNITPLMIDGSGVQLKGNSFTDNQAPPIQLAAATQALAPAPTLTTILGYNAADQPAWLHVSFLGSQTILTGEVYVVNSAGTRFQPLTDLQPMPAGPNSLLYSIPLELLSTLPDQFVGDGTVAVAGTFTYPNGAGQTSVLSSIITASLQPPPAAPTPVVDGCDLSGLTPTQVLAKIEAASKSDTECLAKNKQYKWLYWSHAANPIQIPLSKPLTLNQFSDVPLHLSGVPPTSVADEQAPKIRFVPTADFTDQTGLSVYNQVQLQYLQVSGFQKTAETHAIGLHRSGSTVSNLVLADNAIGIEVGLGLKNTLVINNHFQHNAVGILSRGDGVHMRNNAFQGQTESLIKLGTMSPYATPTIQSTEMTHFSRSSGETIRVTLGYGKSSPLIPAAKKMLRADHPKIELVLSDSATSLLHSHVVSAFGAPFQCTDDTVTRTLQCEFLWRDMKNYFPAAASFAVAALYQDGQTSAFTSAIVPPTAIKEVAGDNGPNSGGADDVNVGDPEPEPPIVGADNNGDSDAEPVAADADPANPLGNPAAADPAANGDSNDNADVVGSAADGNSDSAVPAAALPATLQPVTEVDHGSAGTTAPSATPAPTTPSTTLNPFTGATTLPTTTIPSTPAATPSKPPLQNAPPSSDNVFETIGPSAPAVPPGTDSGGCSLRVTR